MSQLKSKILALAEQYFNDTVDIRRRLHEYPELSFKEYETSTFIQEKLSEYGLAFKSGLVETGVVALIKGKNPESKCIALRADIDALPIQEMNNLSYASKNDGVMHACGHDFHTASLLGVARILNDLKDSWEGSMKLIFQPGEEKLPGGASLMIKEGVLENPKVNKIIGQHVSPELDCGIIGMKEGMFMASADEIYIDVIGKGGHAAIPEGRINPLVIASKLITKLYDRFDSVKDTPSVLSIGVIQGGSAGNIIPEKVSMQGTFRAMNEDWRSEAHQIIEEICSSTSKEMGGKYVLEIRKGYPFLKNDEHFTEHCFTQASELMGSDSVIKIPKRMTAEDFAYYSHHVPSCFYRIGVGDKNGSRRHLHNPNFNVEEAALKHSIGLMSWLAIKA
ncbi:MAG: amidohydrolase [Flavobacteriales bacterium]|nr:amidohydrolase [Flavobacteriales bacterium]MBL6872913.1 amidohydrolase [Flavobacteriales bacterium]